jgi:hypothetical protein
MVGVLVMLNKDKRHRLRFLLINYFFIQKPVGTRVNSSEIIMTKKDLKALLTGKKVYVGARSEEVQKRAFELGFEWTKEPKDAIKNLECGFIFFSHDGKRLGCTSDVRKFNAKDKVEISVDTVLQDYIKDYDDGFAAGYAQGKADAMDAALAKVKSFFTEDED